MTGLKPCARCGEAVRFPVREGALEFHVLCAPTRPKPKKGWVPR